MRSLLHLMFGLCLVVVVNVHCYDNTIPQDNMTNDRCEETVQLKTDLKQLKQDTKHMKKQLYRVINSLRDYKKERDVYKQAVSNLTLELQSVKMEHDTLNISFNETRQDLLSTRSEIKTVQASVRVTGKDVLSMKSELTQVQTSTKSEITAVNTSLSAVWQEQESTTSRLRAMEERIVQLENAKNNVGGSKCPDGFHAYGESCYMFSTVQETFEFAMSECRQLGSQLAVVTSKSEDAFLRRYVRKRGKGEQYFLGATDHIQEGSWTWTGGKPMVYTNWGRGEPTNYYNNEHCLTLYRNLKYRWNDTGCHFNFNFICERPL